MSEQIMYRGHVIQIYSKSFRVDSSVALFSPINGDDVINAVDIVAIKNLIDVIHETALNES